jgi:hypothetical protein
LLTKIILSFIFSTKTCLFSTQFSCFSIKPHLINVFIFEERVLIPKIIIPVYG